MAGEPLLLPPPQPLLLLLPSPHTVLRPLLCVGPVAHTQWLGQCHMSKKLPDVGKILDSD